MTNKQQSAAKVNLQIGETGSQARGVYLGRGCPLRLKGLVGMSPGRMNADAALAVAILAEEAGVDVLQDVSIIGDLHEFKTSLMNHVKIPVGTVLAYEVIARLRQATNRNRSVKEIVLDTIRADAELGVSFMTVHASLSVGTEISEPRAIHIGSRAGMMLLRLCRSLRIENPLREYFDDILVTLAEYQIVLSLGSYARSCSVVDTLDDVATSELHEQARLALLAQQYNVPVLLEGLSHSRIGDIRRYVRNALELHGQWLITALGPIPTDVALGDDHIAGSIGATIAAIEGVSMVSLVTSSEHVSVPTSADTVEAIRAGRIASHVAAIESGLTDSLDRGMSFHRQTRQWSSMHSWAINKNNPCTQLMANLADYVGMSALCMKLTAAIILCPGSTHPHSNPLYVVIQ